MKIAGGHVVLERPDAPLRVLAFHHAGGSALSYLPLMRQLPSLCEPCLFELPGRGSRANEPPASNFAEAVRDLLVHVTAAIDRPVLVIGHSLGAILGHSIVSALPDEQRGQVRVIVVSGFASPADTAHRARHPPEPFLIRSRQQLASELRELGGCSPEVFDDPELLEHAVTLFGHDLHLVDTYAPPDQADVDAAYHVWFGRDDRHLDIRELQRWATATTHPPVVRPFGGGHFYLTQESAPVSALRGLVTCVVNGEPQAGTNGADGKGHGVS